MVFDKSDLPGELSYSYLNLILIVISDFERGVFSFLKFSKSDSCWKFDVLLKLDERFLLDYKSLTTIFCLEFRFISMVLGFWFMV